MTAEALKLKAENNQRIIDYMWSGISLTQTMCLQTIIGITLNTNLTNKEVIELVGMV